jgi:uncharacterized membrane protein HdeD (DUF308 family)
MSRNWWMLLLRGVFAILFGIIAWLTPGIALASLVLLFGVYVLIDGVATIISAFNSRATNPNWWVVLLEGIVGVIAGVITFLYPGVTTIALLYIIAIWMIITGVMQIIAAVHLRKEITGEFWLGLAGLLSILVGGYLILNPGPGILALLWVIAVYSIVFGIMLIMLAFRVRGMSNPNAPMPA